MGLPDANGSLVVNNNNNNNNNKAKGDSLAWNKPGRKILEKKIISIMFYRQSIRILF